MSNMFIEDILGGDRVPRYLQSSIDEVLNRSDIVDIVSSYVTLKRNGSDYVGLCPFHREKTPSFHISSDKQLYYCFGCGSGGNIIDFIGRIENLDFIDTIKFLAERAGITLEEEVYSPEIQARHDKRETILKMNKLAAKRFVANLSLDDAKGAREYAFSRGLNRDTIRAFGIGFARDSWSDLVDYLKENGFRNDDIVEAGLAAKNEKGHIYDKFRNRLMFPIIDVRGNVIAFSGRALDDSPAKYMNSPETPVFHKGNNIFALNIAKQHSASDGLILVEGNMDAVSLHAFGFPNAVAGLGTALTDQQAQLLKRYSPLVYICYDNDEAGAKACEKAIDILSSAGIKLKVLSYKDAKDPDEYLKKKGAESFKKVISSALSATEYKILNIRKKYNLVETADKVEFINAAAEILATNPNAVEREIYIKRIASETDISTDSITAQVNRVIYDKNRKTYKKAERVVQSTKPASYQRRGDATPTASYKSERMLLNVMFFNLSAYKLAKSQITATELSDESHRQLFTEIVKFKETNESADAGAFLASIPEALKPAAAQILYKEYVGDAQATVTDNIEKIKKQNFNETINRLAKEGKVDEINELIKAKHMGGVIK